MKTLATFICLGLPLLALSPSESTANPRRNAPLPFSSMDVVAVEPARPEHRASCVHPRDVELPRMTVVWRQGRTRRWAVGYFPKSEIVSPYGSRSSRFYCDDHVEFSWDEFDFAECERWHPRLRPLAPTKGHRLVQIFRGEDETMEAVFCTAPSDCTMMQVWLGSGQVREFHSHGLDYPWE